jgi:hypothetical protein
VPTEQDPIAQVVERDLLVGHVGHVARVRCSALIGRQTVDDEPDTQSERAVDGAHPLGVALGEVIVDGHDVHRPAGERRRGGGQRRGQRLALARLHFGHRAVQQDGAADHLDVVVALSDRPIGGLAHERKDAGDELLAESLPAQALAELGRRAPQHGVGHPVQRATALRDLGDEASPLRLAPRVTDEDAARVVDGPLEPSVPLRLALGVGGGDRWQQRARHDPSSSGPSR